MKYRIILIVALIGSLISCEKEISTSQADNFMKFYGNYLSGEASDVDVLDNGGYAMCGTDSTSEYGKRMVLIVTDAYGNIQNGFPKYFTKGDLEAGANSVEAIKGGHGGYMLFGFVESQIEGTTETQKDVYVVKVSPSGEEIWDRTYGSSLDEVALHATERTSSGYMISGYQVKDGASEIMIFGIEEEGKLDISLPHYVTSSRNSAANYIVSYEDRYFAVCTYDKIGTPGTDILVLNLNDDLGVDQAETLTGDADEFGMCIIEDGPDQFLVLGNRYNEQSGRKEMVVYLLETEGIYITKKPRVATISQSNADLIGRRFTKTDDGRYAIVGTRQVSGSGEIFLQFLSSVYAIEGNVAYGASGNQVGADIEIADDGGIVLLGTNGYEKHSMISLIKTSDTGDF